jgi:ABC-type dipeptide/oligopeptide/nickel transport system permease component
VGRFILQRILAAVLVILGVITITFVLMYMLPGDPAASMLARSGASGEQIAQLRAEMGLDRPLYSQYFYYIADMLSGDLGTSLASDRPVAVMLLEVLPKTLILVFVALLIAVPVGTLMGVTAAVQQNTWVDRLLVGISALGVSIPSFFLALIMILLFSVTLRWLPASGQGGLEHLILPTLVLAFGAFGTVVRTARTSMIDVLKQDYIRTARAKGKSEQAILYGHALPNALVPVVTMIGLQFGWLVSGSFIVETVFSRQGLGSMMINAILDKDLPLVQGAVLCTAILYVTLNLLVDLTYGLIDPRIRYD